ncbi:exosortase [bacterium]|nr:exosortase [bacterium]
MIPTEFGQRLRRWCACSGALVLLFSLTLWGLLKYCLENDLFSYVLLVPAISAWLIWQDREQLRLEFRPAVGWCIALGAIAAAAILCSFVVGGATPDAEVNRLTLRTLGFVAAFGAVSFFCLGGIVMRQVAFPAAFLIFMVPLPPVGVDLLEMGLQHASAVVAGWFFSLTGATYLQSGLVFNLPNITIQVAPECSGIRSTLVLFMTSLIAGHLFLRHNWQRAVFALLVIPLGVARNGFRIVTIGWLCTEYGPQMIHSWIHHKGGPVFFALSLLPLFGLLFLFRWMNNRRLNPTNPGDEPPASRSTAPVTP